MAILLFNHKIMSFSKLCRLAPRRIAAAQQSSSKVQQSIYQQQEQKDSSRGRENVDWIQLQHADGRPFLIKAEGIEVYPDSVSPFISSPLSHQPPPLLSGVLVIDADDSNRPAHLCSFRIQKRLPNSD